MLHCLHSSSGLACWFSEAARHESGERASGGFALEATEVIS